MEKKRGNAERLKKKQRIVKGKEMSKDNRKRKLRVKKYEEKEKTKDNKENNL